MKLSDGAASLPEPNPPSSSSSLIVGPVTIPIRLAAFPPDFGTDLDQVVPGRKNFAAKQFDYHLLALGHRPPIFQPEQVPTTFVPRPRRTHPAPLCSVLLRDPPIERFASSEHSLLRQRQRLYELLQSRYSSLPDQDFRFLSYWVSEHASDPNMTDSDLLHQASLWPGFLFQQGDTTAGTSPRVWLPIEIVPSSDSISTLLVTGFGGIWTAHDCGDQITFGAGGSRANSCVFKAVAFVLHIIAWLMCLQTLRLASHFLRAIPHPLPESTPAKFRDMVNRVQDLTVENSPFDPMVLMALAPPCIRSYRLVFLFVPETGPSMVIVLSPTDSSSAPIASTGFILLYHKHAWALEPPPHLVASQAAFATWLDTLPDRGIPVQQFPYLGWRNFWRTSWPTGPLPPSHPSLSSLPTFGGLNNGYFEDKDRSESTASSGRDNSAIRSDRDNIFGTWEKPAWDSDCESIGTPFEGDFEDEESVDDSEPESYDQVEGEVEPYAKKRVTFAETPTIWTFEHFPGEGSAPSLPTQDSSKEKGESETKPVPQENLPLPQRLEDLSMEVRIAALEYVQLRAKSKPEVDTATWKKATQLGDSLVKACQHSVPLATQALRLVEHPSTTVKERDTASMEAFLELGILPKDLTDVKRDRAYHGVPSYFEEPPSRQGRDSIQPSLRDHAVEGISSIWDEYRSGKIFLVSAKYREEHLSDLPNSPLARVPKHDARGRVQPTGRIIRNHSFPRGQSVNDAAVRAPPGEIKLPTVQHLVGDFLFLRSMFPHQRILFAKCDVSGAFQWVALRPEMVPYMGSYVEGPPEEGYVPAFAFSLRCTFGFLHSPAEWDTEAKSLGTVISATRFENPRRDGPWEPISREYVDDLMLMSPDIGWRPHLTMYTAENAIKGLLGESAINLKKHAIEGKWATVAIFLGFEFDSVAGTMALSLEKLERARTLLNDPKFDVGSFAISRHDLQVLQGSLHHWSQACRPIQGFTSGLLRILSKTGDQIDPSWMSPEDLKRAWERLWADVGCMRMILSHIHLVSSPLVAPYMVSLPPPIRMRLARQEDRFAVLGTDATEWSVAAVDFESRSGTRIQLPRFIPDSIREAALKRGLRRGITRKGESLCMAITELLSVILGLLQWGHRYRGSLVILITDNHSVLSWLRNRCARNVYAQALLRLMIRMEIQGGYEVWSEDIRSEDNHLPDALSRLYDREGNLDPTEKEKWVHYSQQRGGVFEIQEAKHCFPSEWFTAKGDRNWTMLLPGESEDDFKSWHTEHNSVRESQNTAEKIPDIGPCGSTLTPRAKASLRTRLDAAKKALKENALAQGTHEKYGSSFKIWSEFRELLGKDPYLRGDARENAEEILDFIAYQGVIRGLKHGTVQGHLTGIRHYHMELGLGEVTKHPRITATMKGLKKISGVAIQKRPVTPQMLIHIMERLQATGKILHKYLNSGINTNYFFMLRSTESLGFTPTSWDVDKIVRRKDVKFKFKGKYITQFWRADEVEIHIRSSKTDQIGAGVFRSMKASGEALCVVQSIKEVYALGREMEDTAPLFLTPMGIMITREMVSDVLKQAARDLGDPIDEYSSHSLRRGGATALYSKGYSREEIMYMGRWKSDTWLRYAKMTQEKLSDAGRDLATASYTLAGGNTVRTPTGRARPGAPDVDVGMLAWYDPDPEDPGTFVLIHVEYEPDVDQRVARYVDVATWDQEKASLPSDPSRRVQELMKRHTVHYSDPRQVDEWIATHPVILHLGERSR